MSLNPLKMNLSLVLPDNTSRELGHASEKEMESTFC